jgi:hypothetical protein
LNRSSLTFIHNKKVWGFVFRFGFFEISEEDFGTISKAMKKMLVKENADGIVAISIAPIEDLAGVDAGKISLEEAKRKLDDMRRRDRD